MRHLLFLLFLALLALSSALFSLMIDIRRALLLGFDLAAAVFIAATFVRMGRASPDRLRATAARNDAGRALLLLITGVTVLVVLIGVGLELERTGAGNGREVVLVAVTLMLAWLFGNTVYALHYAHLFYDEVPGGGDHAGLAFPGKGQPDFADFCYFAFVLGMTFQVSDVQIMSARMRRTATVHGLLAFVFNIGVVALSVNLIAAN